MSDSFRINTLLYATALKKQLTCCPGIAWKMIMKYGSYASDRYIRLYAW